MHLDFTNALNLVSTITLIKALVFTGLQVRAANRARLGQPAVTVIETAALTQSRLLTCAAIQSSTALETTRFQRLCEDKAK